MLLAPASSVWLAMILPFAFTLMSLPVSVTSHNEVPPGLTAMLVIEPMLVPITYSEIAFEEVLIALSTAWLLLEANAPNQRRASGPTRMLDVGLLSNAVNVTEPPPLGMVPIMLPNESVAEIIPKGLAVIVNESERLPCGEINAVVELKFPGIAIEPSIILPEIVVPSQVMVNVFPVLLPS